MNILSYENCLLWSWAFALQSMAKYSGHKFVRILRHLGFSLDQGLLDFFDIILVQNVDSLKQIKDKKKVVCRMGGMNINDKNSSKRYDNPLADCAAIISTNKELYNVAIQVNDNSFLIPNGVDLDIFKPIEKKERMFTVGFAGNICGQGMHYKGWRLYDQAILRLSFETNMGIDHIECLFGHSQISHNDMPLEFYNRLDCLILPSLSEGCSNVTMEALACGVPVITTKVGYHGENLIYGENVLFIERDALDIVEKVKLLMNDKILQKTLSINGRKFAEQHHNIETIAKQYDEIFDLVIK